LLSLQQSLTARRLSSNRRGRSLLSVCLLSQNVLEADESRHRATEFLLGMNGCRGSRERLQIDARFALTHRKLMRDLHSPIIDVFWAAPIGVRASITESDTGRVSKDDVANIENTSSIIEPFKSAYRWTSLNAIAKKI
jgi:hypothetical protein